MQRDEFLPLRVIRQELATGDLGTDRRPQAEAGQKRRAMTVDAPVSTLTQAEVIEQTGVGEGVPSRAAGVRDRPARPARRQLRLRRDRPGDHPGGERALQVRGRRAQPARLPHLGGSRGRAAAAARRRRPALAQPGAPQGSRRIAREPCLGLRASEAAAAGSRPAPAQGRRVSADAQGLPHAGDRCHLGADLGPRPRPTQPAALVAEDEARRGCQRRRATRPLDRGARDRAWLGRTRRLPQHRQHERRALRLGAGDRGNSIRAHPSRLEDGDQDSLRRRHARRSS